MYDYRLVYRVHAPQLPIQGAPAADRPPGPPRLPAAEHAAHAAQRAKPLTMVHDVIATCPVCAGELTITRLHCRACGSALEGEFGVGRFGKLDREQLSLLESFLRSRGNLKEMERELGISYPTVRGRVDALVRALGFGDAPLGDETLDDADFDIDTDLEAPAPAAEARTSPRSAARSWSGSHARRSAPRRRLKPFARWAPPADGDLRPHAGDRARDRRARALRAAGDEPRRRAAGRRRHAGDRADRVRAAGRQRGRGR